MNAEARTIRSVTVREALGALFGRQHSVAVRENSEAAEALRKSLEQRPLEKRPRETVPPKERDS